MKIIVSESQYKFLLENIPVINQIIDKMSEVGYDGLDDKEKTILSDYSQWLQSGQKNEFKYEDDDDVGDQEVGKKIKTALDLRDNHKQIVINGELQNLGPVEFVTNDVPKSFDKYIVGFSVSFNKEDASPPADKISFLESQVFKIKINLLYV